MSYSADTFSPGLDGRRIEDDDIAGVETLGYDHPIGRPIVEADCAALRHGWRRLNRSVLLGTIMCRHDRSLAHPL